MVCLLCNIQQHPLTNSIFVGQAIPIDMLADGVLLEILVSICMDIKKKWKEYTHSKHLFACADNEETLFLHRHVAYICDSF